MRYLPALPIVLALLASLSARGAAPASAPTAEAKPVVIKTLEGIVIDTKAKEVRLAAEVCLQQGTLELFACGKGTREHESILVTKSKPSAVTFALAMLDLAPGRPGFMTEGGAFSPPAGDVLDIAIRYADKAGKTVEVPAHQFLRPAGAEEGLDRPFDWVYVGQSGAAALKAADREGTVICLSNFVEAVIDVPFESTSVNASLLYEANPKTVPPVGTPVEIILKPVGRRIEPKKVEIEVVLKKDQPPMLDGKPMDLPALKNAVNAMPIDVRSAILKADGQERFARVMEVHDLLRDALMRVSLVVLQAQGPAAPVKPAAPPLEITVTADDKVRLGDKTCTVEEFKAKAEELLKGAEAVNLVTEPKTSAKTVAEVMAAARDQGARVTLIRGEPK